MIGAYLKDKITIIRHGTTTQWGEAGTPSEETAYGFIKWESRRVLNIKGEEALSSAKILMTYDSTLTHEDKIKIDGVEHPIVAIQPARDLSTRGMWVTII